MPETNSKRDLIFAILWSLLALGMAAGIIWALPDVAPLPVLIFGVSLVSAFVWWSAFVRGRKKK